MPSFVEIDGRRFDFARAKLELYHCACGEADWNLELVRVEAGVEQTMWLAGTVRASLERTADLHGCALQIEGRDLDELFGALLGLQITSYPGGQDVCSAALTASTRVSSSSSP